MNKDNAASMALATPGYVVTGAHWLTGIHLPDVVMVLSAISLVLSIAHTLVKWNRK